MDVQFVFDLQRFADNDSGGKTGFDALKLLHDIVNMEHLQAFANKWDESGNTAKFFKWMSDSTSPVLKFVSTFFDVITKNKGSASVPEWLNISVQLISIINDGYDLREELKKSKDLRSDATIGSKIDSILSAVTLVTKSVDKLAASGKNSFLLSVVASIVGLTANIIAGADGIDEDEQEKINTSYLLLLKTVGSEVTKKILSEGIADDLINLQVNQILDKPGIKGMLWGDNFTKTGGPLDIIFSVITGVFNGMSLYNERLKKYTEDGIPFDIAKKDAVVDAVGNGLHDIISSYTKGIDDVIFNAGKWIASTFFHKEAYDPDKDYFEIFCDRFKTLSPPKNTAGRIGDDEFLFINIDNIMFYSDDGNDNMAIAVDNDTIWAGRGDDTIHSRQYDGYDKPERNSIFGGKGNDLVILSDNSRNTVYGGADDDKILLTYGTSNKIFGDAGNDTIFFNDSDDNTVEGGHGNDTIAVMDSENIVIRYADGDGNDTVFGFNEDDELKISGEYSLFTNGRDVVVKVGEGSIWLFKTAGQEININGSADKKIQSDTTLETPPPIDWSNIEDILQKANTFTIIRGTEGDDKLSNRKDNAIIKALGGNDHINNGNYEYYETIAGGQSVTIDGGNGNDTICNIDGDNATIAGGDGDDCIFNGYIFSAKIDGGNSVIIDGGAGNDEIESRGNSVTIDGGIGNDEIESRGNSVTIDGGIGNDRIGSGGDSATINGGDGNDKIESRGNSVTIDGGAGNDYIFNVDGDLVTIDGGAGDDTIRNWGDSVTIDGGAGNDTISNDGDKSNVHGGDGNDRFWNHGSNVSISGGTGNDRIENGNLFHKDGNEVSIDGGAGNDTIYNEGSNVSIDGGDADDSITNSLGANSLIDGGNGNDYVYSSGKGISIYGGADNDKIDNYGSNVSIDGGNGDDSVFNDGYNTTINAGSGDDSIYSQGSSVTIDGGDGDDTILISDNYEHCASINGGKGNDLISIFLEGLRRYGGQNTFLYNAGDGNDTISGFNSYDTLSISGGSYSSTKSGNDLILTVGNGKISLVGAASLSELNIVGTYNPNTTPTDTTPADTTPADTTPADTTPADTTPADTTPADTTPADTTPADTTPADTTPVWTVERGGTIKYGVNGENPLITITGLKSGLTASDGSIDGITLDDKTVTLSANVLGKKTVTITDGYTLALAEDVEQSATFGETWDINGTGKSSTVVYMSGGHGKGYSVTNQGKSVLYSASITTPESFTLTGLKSGLKTNADGSIDGITLDDKTVTLSANVLDATDVKLLLSDGYKLALDTNVATVTEISPTWSVKGTTATYAGGKTSGYILDGDGKNVTYSAPVDGETLITITGLKKGVTANADGSINGITITDYNFVLLSSSVLAKNISVKGTGYSFLVSRDYFDATIKGSNGNDTIETGGSENSIVAGGGNDSVKLSDDAQKITINGGKGNDTLASNGKSNVIVYNSGDGNDLVQSFGTADTLSISGGKCSSVTSGDDLILTVDNGKITLDGAASLKSVNISVTKSDTRPVETIRIESPTVTSSEGRWASGSSSNTSKTSTESEGTSTVPTASTLVNQNVYTGGDKVISNYTSEKPVTLGAFTDASFDGDGNFVVNSKTGKLTIQNVADKVIDLRDGVGREFIKAYSASTAGVIDGRNLAGFEMINGSTGSDVIFAGNDGSQLWGGTGDAADALVGGNGTDVFLVGRHQGADNFFNASSDDVVNLLDANLSDIVATAEVNGTLLIGFNTGNVVAIQSSDNLSAAIKLADGSSWRFNHETKAWQIA